jgi:hypothetical protein
MKSRVFDAKKPSKKRQGKVRKASENKDKG